MELLQHVFAIEPDRLREESGFIAEDSLGELFVVSGSLGREGFDFDSEGIRFLDIDVAEEFEYLRLVFVGPRIVSDKVLDCLNTPLLEAFDIGIGGMEDGFGQEGQWNGKLLTTTYRR